MTLATPPAAPAPVTYAQAIKRPSYNFVSSIVLLLLYEASVWVMRAAGRGEVINGVDALFEALIAFVPYGTWVLSAVVLVLGLLYVLLDHKQGVKLRSRYLFMMVAEAGMWAVAVFFLLPQLTGRLFSNQLAAQVGQQTGYLESVGLSLGAGFYEEFFFRLVLVRGLQLIISTLGGNAKSTGMVLVVVLISAVLFSAAHYIGSLGDAFSLSSFVYRLFFGLLMNALLVLRRFGITAWTHALYDVLVYTAKLF